MPRYLWFKALVFLGLVLGLLLLIQTVATYRYVVRGMVRAEAQREADRRVVYINKTAWVAGIHDPSGLLPVIDDVTREAPLQIAWVRVLNLEGNVIVQSGNITNPPTYAPGTLGKVLVDRDRVPEIIPSSTGPLLVALRPFRLPPVSPVTAGNDPGYGAIQIAVGLDRISMNFGRLRRNLILGCTAALTLLAAVVVIGLRFRHYLIEKRTETELAMARAVQLHLLPAGRLLTGELEFAAQCVPAWQVGGDFYDVFKTDDGQIALTLGDVSGKGVPAALLMGVAQGAIHVSGGADPASGHEQSVERLNHLLCSKTALERFVSLFWCYFDPVQAVLRYVNAGHLPPLLVRRGDAGEFEIHRLDEGGPVLGLLPHAVYRQAQLQILPGDLLVAFSDGIVEAADASEQEFGEERVLAAIRENWAESPSAICDGILKEVRSFLNKQLPQDDQTLMVVRLQPVPSPAELPPLPLVKDAYTPAESALI
jgi:serine phosphatase RsbU (regulator of sigma subunit)